jgi:hypothetical protein
MLGAISQNRLLDLGPFSDEISQNLRFDGRSTPKLNGVCADLGYPLDDAAIGFFIAEGITKWEFRDHGDLVELEVMVELAGCNQNHVQ